MSGKSTFTSYLGDALGAELISFDDNMQNDEKNTGTMTAIQENDNQAPLVIIEDTSEEGNTDSMKRNDQGQARLCGYLNKYKVGARGLGKTFKKRWFVHAENTCKLLYYRTPQDIVPLGEMDVSNATFSLQTGQETDSPAFGRPNIFKISSNDKEYYLEAPDQQTTMYWLQELQRKRRAYSRKKTTVSTEKAQLKSLQEPSAGLLVAPSLSNLEQSLELAPILEPVAHPCQTVGESSANSQTGGILTNLSISNWKIELRNALSNIRIKRQSDSDLSVHSDAQKSPSPSPGPNTKESSQTQASPSGNLSDDQNQQKTSRFGSLRRRIKSRSFQDVDLGANQRPTDSSCQRCKLAELSVVNQQEELQAVEEELEANRSVIRVLQKQLDVIEKQMKTRDELEGSQDSNQELKKLNQQDKTIVDLEHLITTLNEEKELQNVQLKMLESKVTSLDQELEMFKESMRAKDEMIVSLTNQIFERENRPVNTAGTNTTLKRKVQDVHEIERLRDAVSGYELQNKFLNKEILELNRLRTDDEARERELYMRCTEWEARYYQVHSKYLLTLEQLKLPVRGGDENSQEFVTQLLNDAMDLEESMEKSTDLLTSQSLDYSISNVKHRKYDKYGFLIGPQRPEDLLEKASNLQRRSDELRRKDVSKEVSNNVKWENFFINLGNREIQRSQDIKNYIRDGVPYQYKERVWNACIGIRISKLKAQVGTRYYLNLLENMQKQSHRYNPAAKQIELDLLRTLPHNKHYQSLSSDGIPKLKRVLLAYTQHNPDLGYCQGQNRLAAIALLFLNEEDAFWCLVAITEFLMPPEYYSRTLIAAQVDQRVLKDLMAEKLPQLTSHMERMDVDLSLFTFNWFLTIFVDNIPTETFLRIWDVFLYEGNKVLFRFAMAFYKYHEEDILAIQENMALHTYLREMAERAVDINKISQIAFIDMNPLPMRHIQARRQVHMLQVKSELDELDALRTEFRSSRKDRKLSQEDFSDDDL